MNKIKQLQELQGKENFPYEEWQVRRLTLSPKVVICNMNQEITKFIIFLQNQIQSSNFKELPNIVQDYLDNWYPIDFDTEEREFIADKMFGILKIIEVDTSKLFL